LLKINQTLIYIINDHQCLTKAQWRYILDIGIVVTTRCTARVNHDREQLIDSPISLSQAEQLNHDDSIQFLTVDYNSKFAIFSFCDWI